MCVSEGDQLLAPKMLKRVPGTILADVLKYNQLENP